MHKETNQKKVQPFTRRVLKSHRWSCVAGLPCAARLREMALEEILNHYE
jgi:hypothetical protein